MADYKKPGAPMEEERWAELENEIQNLKRSNLIFSISLLLQTLLYGFLILILILRVNRIGDALVIISDTVGITTDINRTTLQILDVFKNFFL